MGLPEPVLEPGLQLLPHSTQKLAQFWRVRIITLQEPAGQDTAFILQVCHTISDPQRFTAMEAVEQLALL